MARLPRVVLPGMPLHLVQRGNNRCDIFRDDRDRRFFLACLQEGCEQHGCDIHAYVLMTNHVHVLLTPATEEGPARLMQVVGTRYVQYFNSRHQRIGTLWQGRYKAAVVDTEPYFLVCSRYIELNPVRAGMVSDPGDHPWSSYACNGLARSDSLIREHSVFESLGRTRRERCDAYAQMFADEIGPDTLDLIRTSTNKGWALGDERFRKSVEKVTRRQAAPRPRGKPTKRVDRVDSVRPHLHGACR